MRSHIRQQMRMPKRCHVGLFVAVQVVQTPILLLTAILCIGGDRGFHYSWEKSNESFYVAERGEVKELVKICIREAGNPFSGLTDVLIQARGNEEHNGVEVVGEVPHWPSKQQKPSQELLERMESRFPGYRYASALLQAGRYLNREIGAFRRSWIIGTDPLAVAFLEDGPRAVPEREQARIQRLENRVRSTTRRTEPATGPTRVWRKIAYGVFELQAGSETLSYDMRERYPEFVRDEDQDTHADVVLLFPENLHIASNGHPALYKLYPGMHVKVIHLPQPRSGA